MSKKQKIVYLCTIDCPSCQAKINVLKETKIIHPAEPAEKEERFYAEKVVQTTLPGGEEE